MDLGQGTATTQKQLVEGDGSTRSQTHQMDGDMTLDASNANCVLYLYLSGSYNVELPVPVLGQWLIIQNATPTTSGFTLTVTSVGAWSGASLAIGAGEYASYRAMDKNGAILWRDLSNSSGMTPD